MLQRTSCVQPLSCDEAFMDVTGARPQPSQAASVSRSRHAGLVWLVLPNHLFAFSAQGLHSVVRHCRDARARPGWAVQTRCGQTQAHQAEFTSEALGSG